MALTVLAVFVRDNTVSGPAAVPAMGDGSPPAQISLSTAWPSTVARGPGTPPLSTAQADYYALQPDLTDTSDPANPVYYYQFTGSQSDPTAPAISATSSGRPGD